MKKNIIVSIALAVFVCNPTSGLDYPEHNFSIQLPSGWTAISPPPPQTVLAVRSPDQSKILMVAASIIPQGERENVMRDSLAGAKQSFTDQGMKIDPAQTMTIGALPFQFVRAHMPAGGSVALYAAGAGDRVYILNAISRTGDAANDAELLPSVLTFRLLQPHAASAPGQAPIAQIGVIFGSLAVCAVVASLAFFGARVIRANRAESCDLGSSAAINRHPFRKAFVCAGILWCFPLAGILATGGNVAYRIGYTLAPFVITALITAVWAKAAKSHWGWPRYALTVFLFLCVLVFVTLGGKLGNYAR